MTKNGQEASIAVTRRRAGARERDLLGDCVQRLDDFLKTAGASEELRDLSAQLALVRAALDAQQRATTGRRQGEARLLHGVLNALPAHIAVLGIGGDIIAVNDAWRRFARDNGGSRALQEGVGLNYLDACDPAGAEDGAPAPGSGARAGIEAVIRGELPLYTDEYPCHSADEQRWFLLTAAPLGPDADGAVVAHVDISERIRAEQASRKQREALAHASRLSSVGVLAASLVHELTQPLTAAGLYSESLMTGLRAKSLAAESVATVLGELDAQLHRAAEIVDGLRRFVRRQTAAPEVCDLGELLEQARGLVRMFAQDRKVSIHVEPPDRPLPVQVIPVQIVQVLVNLIHNAVEAIDAAASGTRRVQVWTEATGDTVQVAVRDTGPGLPPSAKAKMFKMFETEKMEGLGMGLAISRSIVEAHKGRLWADEAVSGGALFRFTLPLADKPGRA